jgi:ATP-dependent DNA helicase RecG
VDYPETALRQIFCDAILHRSCEGKNAPVLVYIYSDRIKFISPGGPYGNLSPANFERPGNTAYRNPNLAEIMLAEIMLAEIMKNLDIIQRFGMGIYWARESMKNNGKPPPEFDVDDNFVRCTLRKRG